MKYVVNTRPSIENIGDAIREKLNVETQYKVEDMPAAIRSIGGDGGSGSGEGGSGSGSSSEEPITVDSALSSSSENPVQNKVIYAALNNLSTILNSKASKPIVSNNDTYTAGTTSLANGQIVIIYESGS